MGFIILISGDIGAARSRILYLDGWHSSLRFYEGGNFAQWDPGNANLRDHAPRLSVTPFCSHSLSLFHLFIMILANSVGTVMTLWGGSKRRESSTNS